MKRAGHILGRGVLVLAIFSALLAAQTAAAGGGFTGSVVPPSYLIGPNDVLSMSVFAAPELNDPQMQVDTNGTVLTPYGASPVHVSGLTTIEAAQAIATELVQDQLAVNPKVEVRVVQPESHPVIISGQGVRSPGTIQAIQPIRLLDALTRAGGLSDNNGALITVIRPGDGPNATPTAEVITANQLMAPNNVHNPWLRGGEQIQVMPGGNAYLSGDVVTPGAYPLSDSDPLTVRKLMAKAHGLGPANNGDKAQLIHNLGQPSQTVTIINLPAIISGQTPDIALAADDMIYVPTNGTKRAGANFFSRAASVLTVAAGELLVR